LGFRITIKETLDVDVAAITILCILYKICKRHIQSLLVLIALEFQSNLRNVLALKEIRVALAILVQIAVSIIYWIIIAKQFSISVLQH